MKKTILSLAVLAMAFVGCKKEVSKSSDSSTSSLTPRISKEISYTYYDSIIKDTSITIYTYDSKGRLISQKNDNDYSLTYSYISNNLISCVLGLKFNDSVQNYKFNYILDSKGLATKIYSDGKTDTTKINYTSDGYASNSFSLGFLFGLSNSSNNQIEVLGENIVKNGAYTYEYYLDKTNVLSYSNYGIYFMGKSSKNLLKSEKWVAQETISMSSSSQYSYEFDSKNRVIKSIKNTVTSNGLSGFGKVVTVYEYIN